MHKFITPLFAISLVSLIFTSCYKTPADELEESFEYNFNQEEGSRGIVTTLKQLGFDDQGIPGNTEPRPFCYNTGGNCVCAVDVDTDVAASLGSLDNAIKNETQQEFFNVNHYGDVFDLPDYDIVEKVQDRLEKGKLFFKKMEIGRDMWYFASKPQHLHREGEDFMSRAVLSVPIANANSTHGGH